MPYVFLKCNSLLLLLIKNINYIKANKANWSLDEIDLFEINEAFSSQCIAIQRELKLDESKVLK